MRRTAAVMLVAARVAMGIVLLGGVTNAGIARADEVKMVGVITHIEIAGKNAKTATATLKDNKSEKQVDITVEDDLTLDKFKDHRIQEGDEIRVRYEVKGGKNLSSFFRKTAGC
jgi:tRNA1(Val) A37 N6-methylase TrmN6